MKKILIFIGARAGSKGVKAKNMRLLMDKPLMVYTIEQAKKWGKASRIIVSSDSQEMVDIAKRAGAEAPFLRPKELATDTASKGLAMKHAFLKCEEIYNEQYDIVIDLDVTAPIRTMQDLDNCLEMFLDKNPKTLFSVVRAHKNPYFNILERNEKGKPIMCKTLDKAIKRRQDAPEVYSANASIYFYRRDYVLAADDPIPLTDDTELYVMDDIAGVDIDREIDFKFVEFLIKDNLVSLI